jgi:hypothetical protein
MRRPASGAAGRGGTGSGRAGHSAPVRHSSGPSPSMSFSARA